MENASNPKYGKRQTSNTKAPPANTKTQTTRAETTSGGAQQGKERDTDPIPQRASSGKALQGKERDSDPLPQRATSRMVLTASQLQWDKKDRERLFKDQFPHVHRLCRIEKREQRDMAFKLKESESLAEHWIDECLEMMDIANRVWFDNPTKLRTMWGRYLSTTIPATIKPEASWTEIVEIGIQGMGAILNWPLKMTNRNEFTRLQLELCGVPRKEAAKIQAGLVKLGDPVGNTQPTPGASKVNPQTIMSERRVAEATSDDRRQTEEEVEIQLRDTLRRQ